MHICCNLYALTVLPFFPIGVCLPSLLELHWSLLLCTKAAEDLQLHALGCLSGLDTFILLLPQAVVLALRRVEYTALLT